MRRDATGKFPSLKLETGVPHRVVVVTGKPSPTITVPGTRFGAGCHANIVSASIQAVLCAVSRFAGGRVAPGGFL